MTKKDTSKEKNDEKCNRGRFLWTLSACEENDWEKKLLDELKTNKFIIEAGI